MTADSTPGAELVDAYLAELADPHRSTLMALRSLLRRLLPTAEEGIRYGVPCFAVQGKGVSGYAAFRDHCAYFPMSGDVLALLGDEVAAYRTSKGGLQFPADGRLPTALLKRMIRLRLDELGEVRTGKRFEFFDDGTLKAVGSMKDGELHGAWKWFRQDGSLLRTGKFAMGEQTGTWTTYDRSGIAATVTQR